MFVELRCMASRGVSFSVGMGVFGVSPVEQEYEVVSKWKNPATKRTSNCCVALRCGRLDRKKK